MSRGGSKRVPVVAAAAVTVGLAACLGVGALAAGAVDARLAAKGASGESLAQTRLCPGEDVEPTGAAAAGEEPPVAEAEEAPEAGEETGVEAEPGPVRVTVQRGDTLWAIARSHGVCLKELIEANPQIPDPDVIDVGDVVTIP